MSPLTKCLTWFFLALGFSAVNADAADVTCRFYRNWEVGLELNMSGYCVNGNEAYDIEINGIGANLYPALVKNRGSEEIYLQCPLKKTVTKGTYYGYLSKLALGLGIGVGQFWNITDEFPYFNGVCYLALGSSGNILGSVNAVTMTIR